MLILSIDTTGPLCSCALYDENEVRLVVNKTDYSHLEEIAPMISALMEEAGKAPSELDAIAVSRGPGSFTGVRIGMATAKAVAQIWKKPIVCVPTLDAFAYGADAKDGEIVCPLFDARRDQVYAAAFLKSGREVRTLIGEAAMPLEAFTEKLSAALAAEGLDYARLVFRGDGAEKFEARLLECFPKAKLADEGARYQTAEQTARLGALMLRRGEVTDCYGAEPEYLREAEAEKKLREKRSNGR
ncbi:MAG: tRNA (adenosine(37)-N6)-threonylcarbamoyltransferase complex dimerization subunit type 1 TsaB [Firmicutes bacterium]|nr:tRNA (adenosine(37)-N6)-threonylcarbamoyltransferase complex dimerization subunit type 1 TsaB [Bacillota bacterium]